MLATYSLISLGFAIFTTLINTADIVAARSNGTNSTIPSLESATVDELSQGLSDGLFSSVDLVNAYHLRISEVNSELNVVTELNPDALSIAESLDAERLNGTLRGPLHGLPVLLKGNIGTDDTMNTTAGSYALLGAKLPRDSTVVKNLRDAGAVILGKVGLTEWANARSSNSTNGWSAYGGQVKGAYYPNQDPSGSSSGSGVAASIGLAVAALGTETAGSILSPSEYNNIVGIKPTVGLTSRSLVVPFLTHQDTIGPMARTVKDAAYFLSAIAGKDSYDNYTSANPANTSIDYTKACIETALEGARIGVPPLDVVVDIVDLSVYAPIIAAFENAKRIMSSAGADVVDNVTLPSISSMDNVQESTIIIATDFKASIASFFAELTYNPNNITSLADLAAFTKSNPLEEYPDRDIYSWDIALSLNFTYDSPEYWAAYNARFYLGADGGLWGALEKYNLDAVIVPTIIAPFFISNAGSPGITVPVGSWPDNTTVVKESRRELVEVGPNIPFGLSFIGKPWSEEKLIGFAYAFEQLTLVRDTIEPYIKPTTELCDVV